MKQFMKNQALPPGVHFRPYHVFEPFNPIHAVGFRLDLRSVVCGKMARYSVIDKYKHRYTGGYQGNGEVQVGYR